MTPVMIIISAWLLFGGSHLLLSGSPLRAKLSARLGPRGFTRLFTGFTIITMTGLITAVAIYGDKGLPGLGLRNYSAILWACRSIAMLGTVLMVAGLINYPRSPMAFLAQRQRGDVHKDVIQLAPPTAIERLVRHPFFTGLLMVMFAHTVLANTLAMMAYFAGFAILAMVGIPLQDRKLRRRWEAVYAAFESKTSNIPASALQYKGSAPEWGRWLTAVLVALIVFGLGHPVWVYANGATFALCVMVFGAAAVFKGMALSAKV